MISSAQKNGLQLNNPEPILEKLGTAAHTKQRFQIALKFGTLLIAIGLVSYVLSTVVGTGLSFILHGYDFSVQLHDLSHQDIPASCSRHTKNWSRETFKTSRGVWSTRSNITVPLSKSGFYVLAEGAADGSVTFIVDEALENEAFVDLRVESQDPVFGKPGFCVLDRIEGTGVGIFTPAHIHEESGLTARITVRLPKFAHGFEMDRIVVSVPDMQVNFDEINLKPRLLSVSSKNGFLIAADIKVEKAEFQSLKGDIIGNFTVSDFLSLKTSTGSIITNITMLNAVPTNPNKPTAVSVTSKRGDIDTNLSLFALDPEDLGRNTSGGSFLVDTRTYTSPINVKFHEAPLNSSLTVASKTVTSPIDVSLPRTFEGRFFSSSGINLPPIGIRGFTDDPSGQNRTGTFKWGSIRTHKGLLGLEGLMSGDITWGSEEDLNRGLVELKSVLVHPVVSLYRPRPKVDPYFIDLERVLRMRKEEEEEVW